MKATFKPNPNNKRGFIVDWTPSIEKHICKLYDKGYSANKIAQAIGLANGKNAVLGRLNKLGKIGKQHNTPKDHHKALKKQVNEKVNHDPYFSDRAARMVDQFGAMRINHE